MERTLHVTIDDHGENDDLEETLSAIDAGEAVDPEASRLSFESLDAFGRVFRSTNLELLQAIAAHEPDSIRALARLVDRHPPDVMDNVHELANCGLIELEERGSAKRPTVWYDTLDVQLPIGDTAEDAAPA